MQALPREISHLDVSVIDNIGQIIKMPIRLKRIDISD
jgi:hypothetical protein